METRFIFQTYTAKQLVRRVPTYSRNREFTTRLKFRLNCKEQLISKGKL